MTNASAGPVPSATSDRPLSAVQGQLWRARLDNAGVRAELGAIRLTGRVEDERLSRSVAEVVEAVDLLRAGFMLSSGEPVLVADSPRTITSQHAVDDDAGCVRLLLADRDRVVEPLREPLVRFHLLRRSPSEVVLGLVADPLLLDARSVYLVLGMVMQAYLGRLRVPQNPSSGLAADPVSPLLQSSARRSWWRNRLRAWQRPDNVHVAAAGVAHPTATVELILTQRQWTGLTTVAEGLGNTASLAVIATLAWWLQCYGDPGRPAVFTTTLDLRDYAGLGPVVGPLTDRILFGVELDNLDRLTFRDLVSRVHTGLLDSVVHYLPYGHLVSLGRADGLVIPPRPDAPWDVVVHYCREPLASSYTRGEASLAREGLSIELFRESELVAGGAIAGPVEVHLAESASLRADQATSASNNMAVVVNYNPSTMSGTRLPDLLATLDALIDRVLANPEAPLPSL